MDEINHVVDCVLDEGLDDWVPLDSLIWESREATSSADDSYKQVAMKALYVLLNEDLASIGDLGDSGFEPWQVSPAKAVSQVTEDCDKVDWKPQGSLYWLANTDKGSERARRNLSHT